MEGIPKWIQLAVAGLIGLYSWGVFAKSSELAAMDAKNATTYAQASDLQTSETRVMKRMDDLDAKINNRLDRLEDLILGYRKEKP